MKKLFMLLTIVSLAAFTFGCDGDAGGGGGPTGDGAPIGTDDPTEGGDGKGAQTNEDVVKEMKDGESNPDAKTDPIAEDPSKPTPPGKPAPAPDKKKN